MSGRLALALVLPIAVSLIDASAHAQSAAKVSPATKTAPAVVEEPRDIVDAIYKTAAIDVRKAGQSPFDSRTFREKYFSKGFDVAITAAETRAAHEGDSVLAFDPISASPDAELKKVTLKTDPLELGKAVVSASFLNHGQPTVVSYDFVKDEGTWKIDDIKGTTEKEAWSVRKILKNRPASRPSFRA